jgi:hypothetical protein
VIAELMRLLQLPPALLALGAGSSDGDPTAGGPALAVAVSRHRLLGPQDRRVQVHACVCL